MQYFLVISHSTSTVNNVMSLKNEKSFLQHLKKCPFIIIIDLYVL